MTDTGDVLALIQRYVDDVHRAMAMLRNVCGTQDILAARRRGDIARTVQVDGIAFRFHGVGCEVDWGTHTVDFDFGPHGTCGGFDAWRLALFARQFPAEFGSLGDQPAIEMKLAELERQGIVVAPGLEPSPHLKYLATHIIVVRSR